jgi:hypothetical protein
MTYKGIKVKVYFLVSTLAVIVCCWISEAEVSFLDFRSEQIIDPYLTIIAKLLLPYSKP